MTSTVTRTPVTSIDPATEVGPLALVRTREDFAEVYAVGTYRGHTKRPTFGLERVGYEALVTVKDDECTGPDRKAGTRCDSTLSVYLPRRGVLEHLATFSTERHDFVVRGEPGASGSIEYRLSAGAKFVETGITLFEQIIATDEAGRELRHAELERVFTLADTHLNANEDPLWPRIFPAKNNFATEDATNR